MKVKYLFVVSIGDDGEVKGAVDAIAHKYAGHPETLTVSHLALNLQLGMIGKPKLLKGATGETPTVEPVHQFGVYLVFHYGNELSEVLDWGKTKTLYEQGRGLAGRFAAYMFDGFKLPGIGKTVLIACNGAKPVNEGDSLADGFATGLAAACKTWEKTPPLVAGWDVFVTVAFPGNTALKGKFLNEEGKGRKVSNNPGVGKVWGSEGAAHKWVWVWDGSSYVRKPVAESGWSDKTTALLTPSGNTAVINNAV